jgi:hypothetical protein
MAEKDAWQPLGRDALAARVAQDIPEGWSVNLGIGIPTLVSNFVPAEREVVFHSENGIVGMGPAPPPEQINPWLVNASRQHVTLQRGGSYISHSDSFALVRGGHLDLCVLGAFQVAENGDLIVGAGSAGCVLANRLSADPATTVLVIEAGGRDTNPWIHIPAGFYRNIYNPGITWQFETEPVPGLGGRRISWPRGKVLGGSSSINGLIYIRGQRQDFDHWRQLGNVGWSYDDVLPHFRRPKTRNAAPTIITARAARSTSPTCAPPTSCTTPSSAARGRPGSRPTPISTAPSRKASAPTS